MRILIVDDDYICRVRLMTIFSAYGQCDNAPNGEIAIRLFEEADKELVPYALIAMDIEMPGMNGTQVVSRMRSIETVLNIHPEKRVKILMVTDNKAIKTVADAYADGCDGYITKPTTPENIKKALGEIGIAV